MTRIEDATPDRACVRCEFFHAERPGLYYCRRNPPQVIPDSQHENEICSSPVWPWVDEDHWCGEFRHA